MPHKNLEFCRKTSFSCVTRAQGPLLGTGILVSHHCQAMVKDSLSQQRRHEFEICFFTSKRAIYHRSSRKNFIASFKSQGTLSTRTDKGRHCVDTQKCPKCIMNSTIMFLSLRRPESILASSRLEPK